MKNKGFTLLEMIVVVAVFSILSVGATTNFMGYTANASDNVCQANIKTYDRIYAANVMADRSLTKEYFLEHITDYIADAQGCPDGHPYTVVDGRFTCAEHGIQGDEDFVMDVDLSSIFETNFDNSTGDDETGDTGTGDTGDTGDTGTGDTGDTGTGDTGTGGDTGTTNPPENPILTPIVNIIGDDLRKMSIDSDLIKYVYQGDKYYYLLGGYNDDTITYPVDFEDGKEYALSVNGKNFTDFLDEFLFNPGYEEFIFDVYVDDELQSDQLHIASTYATIEQGAIYLDNIPPGASTVTIIWTNNEGISTTFQITDFTVYEVSPEQTT